METLCKRSGRAEVIAGFVVLCAAAATVAPEAQAAEGGLGTYLLGTKGPLAAVMPPPGVYFQNDAYFYSGRLSRGRGLPFGGMVGADIKAQAFVELPTLMWVTPYQPLGGKLAFSVTTPIGGPNVQADIVLGRLRGRLSDSIATFGHPSVSAIWGWNAGNFHWSLTGSANVPIGDYRDGAIANIAYNRWSGDISAAATWFDPNIGLDISGNVGVTFNGQNPSTMYRTGTELHFEGAISQYLSKQFSVGAIGYYYQQISDDSGAGASLGGFRGSVAALGGTASYSFKVGELPVTARIKLVREFSAKNRSEGTAGWLGFSMPLVITSR